MNTSAFLGYVGSPELHDGRIRQVSRKANVVRVLVRDATGQDYEVTFGGVRDIRTNRPAGKALYTVSEMRSRPPLRKFVFDSWEEDGQAALEIDAERLKISKVDSRVAG